MTTTRSKTAGTAALGIDFVRMLVHRDNSIFQKIDQDDDVGNDGYIEFTENQKTTGCCIAVQVKAGSSYRSADGQTYHFRADQAHFEYWASHSLPVCGVVYDPDNDTAVWCDVTRHLRDNTRASALGPFTIAIPRDQTLSTATFPNFKRHFLTYRAVYSSDTNFGHALTVFANRTDTRGCYDAIKALFSFHRERFATWYYLWGSLKHFSGHPLLRAVVARLAHIPGHGDIFWTPENWVDRKTSAEVVAFMRDGIGRDEILALLETVDENGFQRGSLGQCVWAMIAVVRRRQEILRSIILDVAFKTDVRFWALWLHVYELQRESKERALELVLQAAPSFPDEVDREKIEYVAASLREGEGLSLW